MNLTFSVVRCQTTAPLVSLINKIIMGAISKCLQTFIDYIKYLTNYNCTYKSHMKGFEN